MDPRWLLDLQPGHQGTAEYDYASRPWQVLSTGCLRAGHGVTGEQGEDFGIAVRDIQPDQVEVISHTKRSATSLEKRLTSVGRFFFSHGLRSQPSLNTSFLVDSLALVVTVRWRPRRLSRASDASRASQERSPPQAPRSSPTPDARACRAASRTAEDAGWWPTPRAPHQTLCARAAARRLRDRAARGR